MLLRVLEAAADRLERAVDEVNALNVYPVPDGDTGTNMVHTVRSALKHARAAEQTVAAISAAAAHGALMGARGNSGVILSQIIRGLKDALAKDRLGNDELAPDELEQLAPEGQSRLIIRQCLRRRVGRCAATRRRYRSPAPSLPQCFGCLDVLMR